MKKNKKDIMEERQVLNESLLSIENALMVAGFVPVIGEIADITLIILYLIRGQKLYAALMLIALVPTVGDIIVKPIIKGLQMTKNGSTILKSGAGLTEHLAKNPKMAEKFTNLSKYVNSPQITKTVEGISKVNKTWGQSLKSMLDKIGGSAISGIKSGTKSVVAGKGFGKGLKDYYKGQRMDKYLSKYGVLPEKGISMWWQNVMARHDRKKSFRQFITSNNLLSYFGLPSLTKFEEKITNDSDFRKKIANDVKISDYIAQNSNENDFFVKKDHSVSKTQDSFFNPQTLTLPILKKLAQSLT